MPSISTEQHLHKWLQTQNIQIENWGQDNAKTVRDLWREIEFGETNLTAPPPIRHVRVVSIIIKRKQQQLIEISQTLYDGRTRTRNHPPSEKFKVDEDWQAAAIRCLLEELHIDSQRIEFNLESYTMTYEIKDSYSYPNLLSCYELHQVEATIEGLPEDDFCVPNKAYADVDTIKIHWWGWRHCQ